MRVGALELVLASALAAGLACRMGVATPPYAVGAAPSPDALLAAAEPPLRALRVPAARLREGRGPAATLMLAAQDRPVRFAGALSSAGQEIAALAVNEHEYGLRWLRGGGLDVGYYAGPPSACAVHRLLGVELDPEQLVALLLGGAPRVEGLELVEQRWQGERGRAARATHAGHEVLVLAGGDRVQELRFVFVDGHWRFSGTSVWTRTGDRKRLVWSVDHEQLQRSDGHVLPRRTVVGRPDGDGVARLTITYERRIADPPDFVAEPDDGWDDGGWEDEPEAPPADTAAPSTAAAIPAVFRPNAAGLVPRGDVCVPR
jgi:hypothetical protein